MKIELFLDTHKVEINQEIDFVLNKQYTELTDLTAIIVDYSKTIKIPMTPSNNELFNMIYKLDHQVLLGTEYINYDPSQKIPMTMLFNGSTVMDGYAILSKVNLKDKTYEINLYGQLGKIFSELKDKSLENYTPSNIMFDPITMNRESVIESFRNDRLDPRNGEVYASNLAWTSTLWSNYFGFAPQLLGDTDILDTTGYENSNREVVKFEDIINTKRGITDGSNLVGKGLDINQYGEIRSYATRPYVYVDKLVQLVQNEINENPDKYDDYRMELDPDWFSYRNPFYASLVYFSEQETLVTDERAVNGSLIFNRSSIRPSTVPYNIIPSINQNDLEGYSYSSTYNGVVTITNEDNSAMNCSIVINGNNITLTDNFYNADVSAGDVKDVRYAMYNRSGGWPIRYIGIYDKNDVLLYRLCLTVDSSYDVTRDSGFLWSSWSKSTMNGIWSTLRNRDERNITPSSYTDYSSKSGNTLVRTLNFNFNDIVLDTDNFRFKYSCMTLYSDAVLPISSAYCEIPFKNSKYKSRISTSSHDMTITYPTTIEVTSTTHRSGSKFSIVEALGADFNPFTWLIDYAKKFRLWFDIDYNQKTITLTSKYFDEIDYKKVIVDYSREVQIEPLVDIYKTVKYGYPENESVKGIQYKKSNKVEYGDVDIDTGINVNNEVMKLIPDEEEGVMIPVITNAITWSVMNSTQQLKFEDLLKTNKVITTLDTDKKIKYFPFFCFRVDNIRNENIRVTDDTETQKNIGKYTYLATGDTNHTTMTEYFPQFDNYYLYRATDWAINNGDEIDQQSLDEELPQTRAAETRALRPVENDGINTIIRTPYGTIEINDQLGTANLEYNGDIYNVNIVKESNGTYRLLDVPIDVNYPSYTTRDGSELILNVGQIERPLRPDIPEPVLPGIGGGGGTITPPTDENGNDVPINFLYWSTFAKPKIVYNGVVPDNLRSFSVSNRWKNYLNEIFNVNNKKVTCYIRMSYPDFIDFKFNQLFVIDNNVFLVNKIVDFNPNSTESTCVELIQISDTENLK